MSVVRMGAVCQDAHVRYVMFGSGAIGGAIGGRLAQAGHTVTLVARGAHLEALRANGLRLVSHSDDVQLSVDAVGTLGEAGLASEDVVILCLKSQDSNAALDQLARVAPPDLGVVCAQNGVENERMALRRFERVYGMCVMMASAHVVPGEIVIRSRPKSGILDLGRYPHGADTMAARIAADLSASGFESRAVDDVMPWKYRKLMLNLSNVVEAVCGRAATTSEIVVRARAEAGRVYEKAGIVSVDAETEAQRRGSQTFGDVPGFEDVMGGSTWQSLRRGMPSVEVDYLNGEIVLLGRECGVPTPINAALQNLARRAIREGWPPGAMSVEALESILL
jgi:2-dehydropantoate 2-reductase